MRDKYPDLKEKVIEFLVTPVKQRPPDQRTKDMFARSIGIDPVTLRRWEQKPDLQREVRRRLAQLNVSPERTQAIVDDMWAMAMDEGLSPKDRLAAMKAYLQYIGQFGGTSKNVVASQEALPEELSDEELEERLASVTELRAI